MKELIVVLLISAQQILAYRQIVPCCDSTYGVQGYEHSRRILDVMEGFKPICRIFYELDWYGECVLSHYDSSEFGTGEETTPSCTLHWALQNPRIECVCYQSYCNDDLRLFYDTLKMLNDEKKTLLDPSLIKERNLAACAFQKSKELQPAAVFTTQDYHSSATTTATRPSPIILGDKSSTSVGDVHASTTEEGVTPTTAAETWPNVIYPGVKSSTVADKSSFTTEGGGSTTTSDSLYSSDVTSSTENREGAQQILVHKREVKCYDTDTNWGDYKHEIRTITMGENKKPMCKIMYKLNAKEGCVVKKYEFETSSENEITPTCTFAGRKNIWIECVCYEPRCNYNLRPFYDTLKKLHDQMDTLSMDSRIIDQRKLAACVLKKSKKLQPTSISTTQDYHSSATTTATRPSPIILVRACLLASLVALFLLSSISSLPNPRVSDLA